MEKIRGKGISTDVILAFYDAYPFTDREDVEAAFKNVTNISFFHSIYWAASFSERNNVLFPDEHGRYGYFLYSKESEWMK